MQFGGQMGQLEGLFGEFWAASAQAFFLRAKKKLFRVTGAGGSGGLAEAFRVYSGIRKANLKRSASGLRPGAAY